MVQHRNESGEFTESVSDGDLLHFFDASERGFFSSREVAEVFNLDRTQAHRRLSELADKGTLERVQVGNRNVVWRRPRNVVVLLEEDGGYSIIDTRTGIASQGETRPEALRMLAEAIESHGEDQTEISPAEIYAELDIDPDEVESDASPPWEKSG